MEWMGGMGAWMVLWGLFGLALLVSPALLYLAMTKSTAGAVRVSDSSRSTSFFRSPKRSPAGRETMSRFQRRRGSGADWAGY